MYTEGSFPHTERARQKEKVSHYMDYINLVLKPETKSVHLMTTH